VHDSPRPPRTNLQLDESVSRLAERIAARYGITVQQLIETLLLECREREPIPPPTPPPPSVRRSPARVIAMADVRRRREDQKDLDQRERELGA
jgi:antitoxin component of RelBE/YafQ-DinJ toxin-antitoxin module